MVIVINSVIGRFSWEDLVWEAASYVQFQVFNHSQLSTYTDQLQLYRMTPILPRFKMFQTNWIFIFHYLKSIIKSQNREKYKIKLFWKSSTQEKILTKAYFTRALSFSFK